MNTQHLESLATIHNYYGQMITFYAFITELKELISKSNQPYYELVLADSTYSISLKIWNNDPIFTQIRDLKDSLVIVQGIFSSNQYGLDKKNLIISLPSPDEESKMRHIIAYGSVERSNYLEKIYQQIVETVETIQDIRMKKLCQKFLEEYGQKFKKCRAARRNHHDRSGGLLEHTAQMMQIAIVLQKLYDHINRDLLITGVLFHDIGKLWEMSCKKDSLAIHRQLVGELLGHISIGIEVVNKLWNTLVEKEIWRKFTPSNEDVRVHIIHLIASHHGSLEFGSPILPKTPEASLLHFIDNIDAKMDMFKKAYDAKPVDETSWLFEKCFGLDNVQPISSLSIFSDQNH